MNAVTTYAPTTVVSVPPVVTLLPVGPSPTPENPPPGTFSPFFVVLHEDSTHTTSSGDRKALVGGGEDGACESIVGLGVSTVGTGGLLVLPGVIVGDSVEGTAVDPRGVGVIVEPGAKVVVLGELVLGTTVWGEAEVEVIGEVVAPPGAGDDVGVEVEVLVEGFNVGAGVGTAVVWLTGLGVVGGELTVVVGEAVVV